MLLLETTHRDIANEKIVDAIYCAAPRQARVSRWYSFLAVSVPSGHRS
nr:hypothetical protein [Candidatus Sigynarchaeum springense]